MKNAHAFYRRTAALLILGGLAAWSSPVGAEVVITSVKTEMAEGGMMMIIEGHGLMGPSRNQPTRVMLGSSDPLEIIDRSNTHLTVRIPEPLAAPGSYLLTVAYGQGASQFDEFHVTIGQARGRPGPGGLISIMQLNGIGCPLPMLAMKIEGGPPGLETGVTQVSIGPDGAISLRCAPRVPL